MENIFAKSSEVWFLPQQLLHEVQNTCRQKVDLGSTSEKVVGAFTRKRDPDLVFYGSLEIEGGKKVC